MQIKAGDTVVVIAGKDKFTKDKKGNLTPTTGKVLKVYPATNKVVVEGVNKVKKHKKPTQANPDGGIVEEEAPIEMDDTVLSGFTSWMGTEFHFRCKGTAFF